MSELGRGPGRTRFGELRIPGQHRGEQLVQRATFGRQEFGGHDLAQQGMPQPQRPSRGVRGQDPGGHRGPDGFVHRRGRSFRDGGDELLRDGPAGEGYDAQHAPRRIRERATWPARVSVRVRGNGPPPPRWSAATSSSTKNGLPSDRAWMRSTNGSSTG